MSKVGMPRKLGETTQYINTCKYSISSFWKFLKTTILSTPRQAESRAAAARERRQEQEMRRPNLHCRTSTDLESLHAQKQVCFVAVPSLKLTGIAPEGVGSYEFPFGAKGLFSEAFAVSFMEGISYVV